MLIELYGENFGCFRDEFRLSMLATDIDPESDRGIVEVPLEGDDEPLRLLRAVAIYGPNGSGKSTIIRASSALRQLIDQSAEYNSDSLLAPYEPFALGPDRSPVRLGIKAIIERRLYDYEIRFDHERFLTERLLSIDADGRATSLIDRIGQEVTGGWKSDEQFALISKDFRPNGLLLSLADRLAPALAEGIAVGIRRLLTGSRAFTIPPRLGNSRVAKRARDDPAFSGWLLSQLRSADLGVVDLRTDERKRTVRYSLSGNPDDEIGAAEEETIVDYTLSLLHRSATGIYPIPYSRESGGTRRLIELAPMLFDLARATQSRAAFVDEIHESFHPLLLQAIIRHLNCDIPLAEAHGQFIFATHETALLDAEAKNAVLRRDQVYLTEKDTSGAARLYSVAEFRERNNLNIRRRYLQGRYGAIPSLGSFPD
jgi:uncharacterized protein